MKMTKKLERAYLSALRAVARDAREISGGKIKPHLRVATKSHAMQAAKRNLQNLKTGLLSDVAKRYKIGKEPTSQQFSPEADELLLYLDNDEPTYRVTQAVQKNTAKKMRDGLYNHALAEKGWTHVADRGSERYKKEIGMEGIPYASRGTGAYAHSAKVRREVGAFMAWRFGRDAQTGEHDRETWA